MLVPRYRSEFLYMYCVFFYGSLMDPGVLQTILGRSEAPVMRPATISGLKIKMWGPFPALVLRESGKVDGYVWELDRLDQSKALQAYESSAYKQRWCDTTTQDADGNEVVEAQIFCWAGSPDSDGLKEGAFDLEWYQKNIKPEFLKPKQPES